MRAQETRLRVRYAETDQMGVVHHAHYFVWMELGRVEYAKAIGFDYKAMEGGDGVLLAVVETHCRYRAPARFDDEVIVKTWIQTASPRMVQFAYEIRRADDNRLLATSQTKHIFCGRDMKPLKLPGKYHAHFGI